MNDTGEIALTIRSVNDASQFSADPIQLKVAKVAKEGDHVGKPVPATDVEGDSLRYSLSFSPEFEMNERSGQITVKQDATIDPMVDHYSVTVTADDQQSEFNTASVDVTINVVEQLTRPPTTGGGGSGRGGARLQFPSLPMPTSTGASLAASMNLTATTTYPPAYGPTGRRSGSSRTRLRARTEFSPTTS